MSVSRLFVKPRRSIGGVTMDAVLSESHASILDITRHPVEVGAEISDHAVIRARSFTITGEVTDTPLNLAAFGEITSNINSLFGSSTEENVTRSVAAYNTFEALQRSKTFIDVQTGLRLYQDCLIESLSVIQDADSSRSVGLTIKLLQVIQVESRVVDISETKYEASQLSTTSGTRAQGASTEAQGRRQLSPLRFSPDKTITRTIVDWAGQFSQ